MSIEARQSLVDGGKIIFQAVSQRNDLLNPEITQTGLIALLSDLVAKGHIIELTAVKSDHHNDSDLGEHCHFNGYCADGWPLASSTPRDYLDANDLRFKQFLLDVAASSYLYQVGLAGSAWTMVNQAASGSHMFHDDGADHVHLGALNP
jgi:hypothetical protein